jgi:hypothetical protein
MTTFFESNAANEPAVKGTNTSVIGVSSSEPGIGLEGRANAGTAVFGNSKSGPAVYGKSESSYGVWGKSGTNEAVHAETNSMDASPIAAYNTNPNGTGAVI